MIIVLFRRNILFFLMVFIIVIFPCCYDFKLLNQPEFSDPNSYFDVPITIELTPEEKSGRGYFGICLPKGWTVRDSIIYSGVLDGMLMYSDRASDSLENLFGSPAGRYWWVGVSDSIYALPEGDVFFSPRIQTNDCSGVFLLDYMISDRIDDSDDRYDDYFVFSNDHPVSVGVLPTTVTVINTNDSGQGSLRQATQQVASGSTIQFDLSYPATILLDSQLVIDRSLMIHGPETGSLTISGSNKDRVIKIKNPRYVSISNLNLFDGNASGYGGGIFCGSDFLHLSKMNICNNRAVDAGGIYSEDSKLRIENITMSNNISLYRYCGGIFAASDIDITIVNSILWGNSPREIYGSPGSLTISHSNIQYGLEGLALTESTVNWLDGNMDIYPVFMSVSDKNYNLHADSPCIDAGIQDTFFVYNDGQDTLFIPEINFSGSSPDIGANEFVDATVITTERKTPRSFYLNQNYPNPFNSVTTFEFSLEHTCHVDLIILTILGEEVTSVLSETLSEGKHHYQWDASEISSGIYLYYLSAKKPGPGKTSIFKQIGKMIHIK
jgi:hypothetical protein